MFRSFLEYVDVNRLNGREPEYKFVGKVYINIDQVTEVRYFDVDGESNQFIAIKINGNPYEMYLTGKNVTTFYEHELQPK